MTTYWESELALALRISMDEEIALEASIKQNRQESALKLLDLLLCDDMVSEDDDSDECNECNKGTPKKAKENGNEEILLHRSGKESIMKNKNKNQDKDGVAGRKVADAQEKVIEGGGIVMNGRTRTISSLIYTFLKMMCRTMTVSPTNVAILGVFKGLMSCLSEKFEHTKYGFGDVILLGHGQRMKIDECKEIYDVFLDSRISEPRCLIAHWFPP